MNVFKLAAKGIGTFLLVVGLCFATAVFTVLIFANSFGNDSDLTQNPDAVVFAEEEHVKDVPDERPVTSVKLKPIIKQAVLLDAPHLLQYPELPRGCEITSLTMLLQFAGHDVVKTELADEMVKDETPIIYNSDGSIQFWGHPNDGFVGDLTLNGEGFGVYHTPLFQLLQQYIPEAVDLTDQNFENVEKQLSLGLPVVAWTTTDYQVPKQWIEWDSPSGKVKTTYAEHAVLIVGFDETHVYTNDPLKLNKNVKINKEQFIESWQAMGSQALSYSND